MYKEMFILLKLALLAGFYLASCFADHVLEPKGELAH